MTTYMNQPPSYIPTKPQSTLTYYNFPNDLIVDNGRDFGMQIQLVDYNLQYAVGSNGSALSTVLQKVSGNLPLVTPSGGVTLPMPKRINDQTVANWEQTDLLSMGAGVLGAVSAIAPKSAVVQGLGRVVGNLAAGENGVNSVEGALQGQIVNPFLWMLYKSPNFKEYRFDWTLTPNTPQESQTLKAIITYLKVNSLPSAPPGALMMKFPLIALIRFYPDNVFEELNLKPCAITSVSVDYTGAGMPSFFVDGSPTTVNLSIALKEIEIQTQENYATKEF